MLYCTRALIEKTSYCILLVTGLLQNGYSSKNKSVMEVYSASSLKSGNFDNTLMQ